MDQLGTVFVGNISKTVARALTRISLAKQGVRPQINPEKPSSYDYMKKEDKGVK